MGEAACLRRSFSNPSQTFNELSEGDPIRALGESVSFGRYMSETLNWEKWSTFSQNRYLEEAEKFSKPGSVAKMKAYFEARYKKFGPKKQASLMQASDCDAAGYVEPEFDELASSLTTNAHAEPLPSVIISSCDPSDQTVESQNEDMDVSDIVSKERLHMVQEQQLEDTTTSSTTTITQYNHTERQCEDAEAYGGSIKDGCVEINVSQSISATGDGIILIAPEKEVTIKKETTKDKLDPSSKQRPADSLLKSSKKSNMSKLSSSLARLATPVRPKKESLGSVANHKSVEKKKSTSKLVQMSVNSNSNVQPVKLSSPASYKTGIGKVLTPLSKMIRQSIVHTPAPSTSRVSVNSVSRTPSATPLSETRRSNIAFEKSFARTNTSNKKLQSPCERNMKSPAPSSITFSPFSFRTEERAAKRREFFEKRLEKEAVNLQLFNKTKTPLARPQQPISKSKPSSSLARGISSQPPQSSFGSRPAWGTKSIQVTLPTKKRHENASPNIL